MSVVDQIEQIARPIVELQNAYIVGVNCRGEHGGKVIEIFVDTDNGVSTDLCAEITRELSRALDNVNLFRGRYHLNVSSPGIDRPLKFLRQYPKNIGRKLKVKFKNADSLETLEGELIAVTDENVVLRVNGEITRNIKFNDIVKAIVCVAW